MKLADPSMLKEIRCGTNVSYVLSDSNLFFMTGYKVLQGLEKNGFLRCVRTALNGRIQLVYLTKTEDSELKTFKAMLNSLDASSFHAILKNWIQTIVQAKTVGFLHCPNIVTALDHVYIDPKTYAVYLIYLPIMEYCAAEDTQEFETEFRAGLVQLIDSLPGFRSGSVVALREALIDGSKTLEAILRGGVSGGPVRSSGIVFSEGFQFNRDSMGVTGLGHTGNGQRLVMNAISHQAPFQHVFQGGITSVGRDASKSDVVISGNPYISSLHCLIANRSEGFYIEDKSANGTYVNGQRLQKDRAKLLHDGDVIRLANSTFKVSIE